MDAALALNWFAMAFMFLIGSIWSEYNVKYGYVIIPFMAGFFWIIGWINFAYLGTIVPFILFCGVMSYLRTHLKTKFGVFGSSSGILFKIVSYVIFLQFAIIVINGMAVFGTSTILGSNPTNSFTQFSIEKASTIYAKDTTNLDIGDVVWLGFGFLWAQWTVLWTIVFGFFSIYQTMVTIFHMSPYVSMIISAGVYLLTAIEVFVLVFKPYRAPEV